MEKFKELQKIHDYNFALEYPGIGPTVTISIQKGEIRLTSSYFSAHYENIEPNDIVTKLESLAFRRGIFCDCGEDGDFINKRKYCDYKDLQTQKEDNWNIVHVDLLNLVVMTKKALTEIYNSDKDDSCILLSYSYEADISSYELFNTNNDIDKFMESQKEYIDDIEL